MKYFLDASNLVFMSLYVSGLNDDNCEDEFSQGLFYCVFMNIVHKYAKQVNIKDIHLVWDSPSGSQWRKSIYPPYKQNRKKGSENKVLSVFFKKLLPKLKEICGLYPLINLEHAKGEGDDIIYGLCEFYKDEEKTIVSSDGDMKQLYLQFDNITVYNPRKKIIEPKPSDDFIKLKAIIGDTSDNVMGVYRVGEKLAPKYLSGEKDFNDKQLEDYNKCLRVVDLSRFEYKKEILDYIQETVTSKEYGFDDGGIEMFMIENSMNETYKNWSPIREIIIASLER